MLPARSEYMPHDGRLREPLATVPPVMFIRYRAVTVDGPLLCRMCQKTFIILEGTMFRKLYLCLSSGERRETLHWVPYMDLTSIIGPALTKGPNRVVPHPLPEDENSLIFRNVIF
jgi:hypothetical protein